MNYYILPKNNLNIDIFLEKKEKHISPYISYSLIYYLNNIYTNLLKLEDSETIESINKIVNPFEFIHTNVPGFTISVSKVKSESNIFFELMEIFQICNIVEILSVKNKINVLQLSPNHTSSNCLLDMYLNSNTNNNNICANFNYHELVKKFIVNENLLINNKFDLMFFEFNENDYTDMNQYIKNLLLVLLIMTKYQSNNGISIIKLDGIFYKIIIDVIFIFTSIYEKVYLIKPSISNITKGERYVVCKHLNYAKVSDTNLLMQLEDQLQDYLMVSKSTDQKMHLHSLIKNEISYYFLNKIEESNSVIGQQQLEAYDQVINIFKNKNKNDKIDSLKRSHIQKCIQWCEKNQLPHNKFTDKVNMFLNP
jgi:hypothetical protein